MSYSVRQLMLIQNPCFIPYHTISFQKKRTRQVHFRAFNSFPRSPECMHLVFCYYMEWRINAGPNNSYFSISGTPSPSLLLRCSARCASPSVCNVPPTYSRELQVSLHANFPIFSSDTATLVSLHPQLHFLMFPDSPSCPPHNRDHVIAGGTKRQILGNPNLFDLQEIKFSLFFQTICLD